MNDDHKAETIRPTQCPVCGIQLREDGTPGPWRGSAPHVWRMRLSEDPDLDCSYYYTMDIPGWRADGGREVLIAERDAIVARLAEIDALLG